MRFRSIMIEGFILVFVLSVVALSCPFLTPSTAAEGEPAPESALPPDINTMLMRSTFKIVGNNGKLGTVFIIGKPIPDTTENRAYYVLVTAAHVFDEMSDDSAIIFFRQKHGDGYIKSPYRYQIRRKGEPPWVKHPKADVAAMFIVPPKDNDIDLVPTTLLSTDQLLQDYDIYPGREIKVLGFPFGTESSSAGFPILRTGSIASYPLIPADRERTFLVDFRVFEGNSGGPVYFHDPYWHKRPSEKGPRPVLVAHSGVQLILGLVSKQVSVTETTQSLLQEVKQKYPISVAEVVHGTLVKETINLLPPKPLPERTSLPLRQMTFISEAIARLQEEVPETSLAQVKATIAGWERTPTEGNWTAASDAVTFEASRYKITSTITVVSIPTNGAMIKYQTVGKRYRNEDPITAAQTTTCTETVPIGLYYIWAERGGKPTSDPNNLYHVVNSQQRIEITEYVAPSKTR